MKRFLIPGILLLFILLILGLVSINLTYLLNQEGVKENLKAILKKTLNLDLNYEKVSVNFYKLHFNFKNLSVEGVYFELHTKKALLDFSWRKLLTLRFFPKRLQLEDFNVRFHQPPPEDEDEEEKAPLYHTELKDFIRRTSPLLVALRNGTIDYTFRDNQKISIKIVTFNAHNDRAQLLLETKLQASCFSEGRLKLRYLLDSNFLESSLRLKALDLAKIPWGTSKNIFKNTAIDLELETVLEKDTLNLSFTGRPLSVSLNRGGHLSDGVLRGYFVGNLDNFELQIENISFQNPKLEGIISLVKENSLWKLTVSVEDFRLSEIWDILLSNLSSDYSQRLSQMINDAEISYLRLYSMGTSPSELFHPKNLEISANFTNGMVYLPEKDLNLTEISGEFLFRDHKLVFLGNCKLEGQVELNHVHLELNFLEKEKSQLLFKGTFKGEADLIRTHAIRLNKSLSFLDKWRVDGSLRGHLKLEGPLSAIIPEVTVEFEGLMLKGPVLEDWIHILRGLLSLSGEQLHLSNVKIKYKDSYIHSLDGTLAINDPWLKLRVFNSTIGKKTVEELAKWNKDFEERLQRLKTDFTNMLIERALYSGPLSKDSWDINRIFKSLDAKGKVYNFTIVFDNNDKLIPFSSYEIPFEISDGLIILNAFDLLLKDSHFSLTGKIAPFSKELELRGEGHIGEKTLKLLQELYRISDSPLALKEMDLSLRTFHVYLSERTPLTLSALLEKDSLTMELFVVREEELKLFGKIKGKKNNFELTLDKIAPLRLKYTGVTDFSELKPLFERPVFDEGLLEGNLTLTLWLDKISSFENKLRGKDLLQLVSEFLKSEEGLLDTNGTLSFKGLKTTKDYSPEREIILSGNANLSSEKLDLRNLNLQQGMTHLLGNVELIIGKPKSKLLGRLELKNLNMRKLDTSSDNTTASSLDFNLIEELFNLPLDVTLDIELNDLTLATGHQIKRMRGNFTLISDELLSLVFEEVNFCELKLYAEFERNREFMYFFADLPEIKGEFLDLFACLYPDEMPRTIFEGPFKIQGFFYTDGKRGLLENTFGKLEIHSDRGYLYRAPLIARVLAFLSPIDLFRGKIPNLETNVLPYEEFILKGEFLDKIFRVDSIFFSAPGFRLFGNGPVQLQRQEVNLTFLVSPFKTLDVIIEHIPLLNRWLLGKERMLVYLPLQVVGKYDQPSIIPLHPASLGKGLFRFIFKFFGITEDFFRTPINLEGFRKDELLKRRTGNSLFR